jgi:hypothetical protein
VGHRAARARGHAVRGGALTTPSQTVGPFFSIGLVREGESRAVGEDEPDAVHILLPGGDTPWIDVSVFARGMLNRVVTRMYFAPDDVPESVPADRRATLIAHDDGDGYRFDIRLQGPTETVFFDV